MLLKPASRLLFIGDSVTDDGRARPVGEESVGNAALGNGYVRMIDTVLAVDRPDLNVHTINMGVSGNTSADLVARWDTDVTALKPDFVVLCIGFNDVWRKFDAPRNPDVQVDIDAYRKNLNTMADKTTAPMLWMTPYYLESNKGDAMRKAMDAYGQVVKEEAKKRNIPVVDLQAEMDEKLLKHYYPAAITWDRVHPQWFGSLVIARACLKALGIK